MSKQQEHSVSTALKSTSKLSKDASAALGEETGANADYKEIEKLIEHGINAGDVKKMKEGGFFTVMSVLMAPKRDLISVKGLSEAKVDKIRECCQNIMSTGFYTGIEVRENRKRMFHISTGSSALNAILNGGIESNSITEAFGEFRSGKTQLSHTLCVTAQLPLDQGGANGKVAFIDTENTFRPERIVPIAQRYDLHPDDVLENIIVARAYTTDHQIELLLQVAAKMSCDQFALLVVDSATSLFRVDYSGRGELAERQQKLNKFMASLAKISEQFNVAVWITNQATPDGAAMFVADPKKPIGGHVMAHASTTRLSLRKGRAEQRICKIYDSPILPEVEATFELSGEGVTDPKD